MADAQPVRSSSHVGGPAAPRIVSLIASATEMVYALGALEWLVGRSHECDFPPEVRALPVCTAPRFAVDGDSREIDRLVRQTRAAALSVYQVFDDVLERLQPTHILTQIQCEVCAVSLQDVERSVAPRLASRPRIVALQPDSLEDVWQDIRRVAKALGLEARGEGLVARLERRMDEMAQAARLAARRPRVACIEWIEPLMPAAHWMPALVAMAGGVPAAWRTWEELRAAAPEIVVVMPCGWDLQRAAADLHWLWERPGWDTLPAVRDGRVYLADGNQYFNRPGPRLVESLQILCETVHREIFPPLLEGTGWRKCSAPAKPLAAAGRETLE
jgi:iron complex transport system substrate-binding protein